MPQNLYHPTAVLNPSPREVAEWLGGELLDAAGAPEKLTGLGTLVEAGASEITFVANDKHLAEARTCAAGLIITTQAWDIPGRPRLVVAQVWEAVARLMDCLYPTPRPAAGVHPTAVIGDGVLLGEGAAVGPFCVIGDGCEIGDGAILGPHCIIDAGCRIGAATRLVGRVTLTGAVFVGARCLIHSGAVLGTDGFKFEPVNGRPLKIPQVGAVIVEDDVEIGANTTIDRAFLYETRIGRGSKIDNLNQIAHNVQIGPGCIMAAQGGIAGSTKVGAGCMMGGQAGLADGITIGDGVMLGAQCGVPFDITKRGVYMGSPAIPIREFWRITAAQMKLPEAIKRLRTLEQQVAALQPPPEKEDL